jgi:hypothetical protein
MTAATGGTSRSSASLGHRMHAIPDEVECTLQNNLCRRVVRVGGRHALCLRSGRDPLGCGYLGRWDRSLNHNSNRHPAAGLGHHFPAETRSHGPREVLCRRKQAESLCQSTAPRTWSIRAGTHPDNPPKHVRFVPGARLHRPRKNSQRMGRAVEQRRFSVSRKSAESTPVSAPEVGFCPEMRFS